MILKGLCDSSYVVVDVAFNTKPTVVNDKVTINQGETSIINVLMNDFDNKIGLDRSSLKITSILKHGIASKFASSAIKIDYSSNSSFSGVDTLTYEICDSSCLCATGKLEVKVLDTSTVSTHKNGVG